MKTKNVATHYLEGSLWLHQSSSELSKVKYDSLLSLLNQKIKKYKSNIRTKKRE
jgi:hypothetical protein